MILIKLFNTTILINFDIIGALHYTHPFAERDYVISIDNDLTYIKEITTALHPNVNIDTNGVGCALLLVICEFLNDIMESRAFHVKLVKEIDRGGMDFQSDFLEFSEQCLQLLSKAAACFEGDVGDRGAEYKVILGKFSQATTLSTVVKSVRHWSLALLQSIQRMLDTPTFVAILQVSVYIRGCIEI